MLRYVVVDDLRVFEEHTHNRLPFQVNVDWQDDLQVRTLYCRNTLTATSTLRSHLTVGNNIQTLFLDHDLGLGNGDMVQWVNNDLRKLIERYPDQIKCITVVSMNPIGAQRLYDDCLALPGTATIARSNPVSLDLISAEIED
jgi:hypothetical protein